MKENDKQNVETNLSYTINTSGYIHPGTKGLNSLRRGSPAGCKAKYPNGPQATDETSPGCYTC